MSTVAEPPCCSGKAAYTHRPPTRLSAHLKDQSKSTEPPTSKEAICLLEISPKVSNAYPPNLTPVATARGQAALHCLPSAPRKRSHSSPSLLTYFAHNPLPIRHRHAQHACSNANTPYVSYLYLLERRACLLGTNSNKNASIKPLSAIHQTPPHRNRHATETRTPHAQGTKNSSSPLQIMLYS